MAMLNSPPLEFTIAGVDMKELIKKVQALGYTEIEELSENAFLAKHGEGTVYVEKVADKELKPELVNSIMYKAMELPTFPNFALVTNDEASAYLDVEGEKSISEIPRAVTAEEKKLFHKKRLSTRDNWSYQQYGRLQSRFNEIHEMIYATKDHVDSTNDAIDEFCKLIFLETFKLSHPEYRLRTGNNAGNALAETLDYKTIEQAKDPKAAVDAIREAFKEVKTHKDYMATLDSGEKAPIFDEEEYLKIQKPGTYASVLRALQELGTVTENGIERSGTLADLSGDVLLRGKYENKGGMGIYLTARQVTEAAVEMVMHDLISEGKGRITQRDADGLPTFKALDACCGSGGFLIKMLAEIEHYLLHRLAGNQEEHQKLLEQMKEHAFIGADNSPGMVLKARINMALHGAPRASIFKTDNSLTTPLLHPCSIDVVLTNPPFKKGGIKKSDQEGAEILKEFQSDIDTHNNCKMEENGLALGAKPNKAGKWNPVNAVDPAVLFLDRYLQLLKPGGLCMMVVPDGILSNSGDKYVREYLMGKKNEESGEFEGGKAILKAVISLPQETFSLSGAGAKTSLLYFKKKEHPGEKQGPVFMAVADEVGFTVNNKVEVQLGDDRNDLLKIVAAYSKK